MIRTQIQLEESQYQEIRKIAHRQRISMAEAIRRLLRQGLGRGAAAGPSGPEALLQLAGVGRSGLGDLGRRHDDYLAEDFAATAPKEAADEG